MATDVKTGEGSTTVLGESRMLINGQLVDAGSGKTFANINPATEEEIGVVADASAEDIGRAIEAARRAFDETDWSTNRAFRKQCLQQLLEGLESVKEEMRGQLVAEVGCPISLTYASQLDGPLGLYLPWLIDLIDTYEWERQLPVNSAYGMQSWRTVKKEAAGVCGAITPWNFPFEVTLSKVAPALAAGNTLVLKPAPDTPWNATLLGRVVAEKTDIPPGVFNVVTSSDHLVGEELVIDPRVDLISFTGSTATGRRIMEKGARTLKRLFLELGGKSAQIVLDDADFAATMPRAAGTCRHAGQICALHSRWLVPRSRYDEAIELITAAFEGVKYGDPNNPENVQGPQISSKQRDRVLGYIDKGVSEGARLVLGGGKPAQYPKGWFVEPTLFADVDNSMTVAREEIFGPVLVVIPFEDDEDAVRIANDSDYGLTSAVTSGSDDRAMALAQQIRTGTVSVNGGIFYGPDAPFGGYKQSGIGRMFGLEGFEEHLETKTLCGPQR